MVVSLRPAVSRAGRAAGRVVSRAGRAGRVRVGVTVLCPLGVNVRLPVHFELVVPDQRVGKKALAQLAVALGVESTQVRRKRSCPMRRKPLLATRTCKETAPGKIRESRWIVEDHRIR